MTYNEIQNLIGALGFPITCCVVMFIQNGKLQKNPCRFNSYPGKDET